MKANENGIAVVNSTKYKSMNFGSEDGAGDRTTNDPETA